jgi:transposase
MAILGLVSSERSTGETTQRGRLTSAGNHWIRRALVERAWSSRHSVGVTEMIGC